MFSYFLRSYCVTHISYLSWSCAPRSHLVYMVCTSSSYDILSICYITLSIADYTPFFSQYANVLYIAALGFNDHDFVLQGIDYGSCHVQIFPFRLCRNSNFSGGGFLNMQLWITST
jgi:hypothetical protein